MSFLRLLSVLVLLAALSAITFAAPGCGSSSGGAAVAAAAAGAGGSSILNGFAAKGPIASGRVLAYILNPDGTKGDMLALGMTGQNGEFNLSFIEEYEGCIYLEVVSGTYTDEATGASVDLQATGTTLAALISDYDSEDGLSGISITPLTTMAAAFAISELAVYGGDPSDAAASSNAQVATYFGLDDIIGTPPPDLTDEENPYQGGVNDAAEASLIAAGLCQIASDSGVTAVELADALAADFSDGVFDGTVDGLAIDLGAGQLDADVTTAQLAASIGDFINSENNASSVDEDDVEDIVDLFTGGGGGYWVPGQAKIYSTTPVYGAAIILNRAQAYFSAKTPQPTYLSGPLRKLRAKHPQAISGLSTLE